MNSVSRPETEKLPCYVNAYIHDDATFPDGAGPGKKSWQALLPGTAKEACHTRAAPGRC